MRVWPVPRRPRRAGPLALAILVLALVAGPPLARAQGSSSAQNVRDDLNRAKAALHGQRYPEAIQRFERLAQAGNAEAQYFLGQMSASGRGLPKDPGKAFYWYDRSAQGGHLEGQAALGSAYLRGLGVERNLAQAAHWSRLAAERGHGGAAYNLAVIYRGGGEGVAQDRAEAEKWAKIAMSKGFPDAMKVSTAPRKERAPQAVALFQQGRQLYDGGDMAGAARVFRQCADLGDAKCQLQYGWHCEEGKGVAKSDAEAVRWYHAAAEQDDPTAQVNLGNLYQAGRGVKKSCKTAVEWFARAALLNDHHALYSLGRMYQFGFGVKEDRAKAHALYRNSAAFGNVRAREALATFNQHVWPDQKSRDIYLARVERWSSTVQGCQAQADVERRTVTCLVPVIDWNPKTWQDCPS